MTNELGRRQQLGTTTCKMLHFVTPKTVVPNKVIRRHGRGKSNQQLGAGRTSAITDGKTRANGSLAKNKGGEKQNKKKKRRTNKENNEKYAERHFARPAGFPSTPMCPTVAQHRLLA